MVCEILSPGTWRRDRGEKLEAYQRAGVRYLWLMEPESPPTVEEYVLTPEGYYRRLAMVSASAVWSPALFPGWSLDLEELQAEIALPEETTPDIGNESNAKEAGCDRRLR